jgi:hypothetical protein
MSADWGDNNIAGVVVISLMEFEKKCTRICEDVVAVTSTERT